MKRLEIYVTQFPEIDELLDHKKVSKTTDFGWFRVHKTKSQISSGELIMICDLSNGGVRPFSAKKHVFSRLVYGPK